MKVFKAALPLQAELNRLRSQSPRRAAAGRHVVGFVPTMGALHRGHLDLIRRARRVSDTVVVSIFVNPLQFGPREDLARYPRPLAEDLRACRRAGADIVFVPETGSFLKMKSLLKVPADASLKKHLCGPFRPGHFDGVTTIVAHFFRIVRPDRAFFGLKDYQQYRVIAAMTRKFFKKSIEIVPVPTVREKDGLAMSSRNRYLKPAERKAAPKFFKALRAVRAGIRKGRWKTGKEAEVFFRGELERAGFKPVQYATIADAETLIPIRGSLRAASGKSAAKTRPIVAAGAAYLGSTRLIDNVLV